MKEATHYRKKAKRNTKLYFNVKDNGNIFLIHTDGRLEDVTQNEDINNLIPIAKETSRVEIQGTCEVESIEVKSFTNLKDDISWMIKPVEKQVLAILKANPEAIITGIKVTYEIPSTTEHVVNIDI